MPNKLKLSRATLAKFLPDHESIKAFEELLAYVSDISPDALADLLLLVSSIPRVNTSGLSTRVAELEGILPRSNNDSRLAQLVSEQSQTTPRSTNLHALEARVEALEQQARRQQNITALIRRIEQLEQITGV